MTASACGIVCLLRALFFIILSARISHQFTLTGTYSDAEFYQEQSLEWEDIEVEFLTNVKGTKLHSNDFHVAKVTLPTSKTVSYTMHISKTEGLFHPDHLGITPDETENLKCAYSGTITENSESLHPKSGLVSLSSCHHEQGFEGLVLLPDNQYYIKPKLSPRFAKRSLTPGTKQKVPHKAFKVNSEKNPFKAGNVDVVLIASPEEVKDALAKSNSNIDALEDEEVAEDLSPAQHEMDSESIDISETFHEDNDCVGSNCNFLPPSPIALANRKKRPNKASQSTTSSSSTPPRVVEIAVFVDEKLFKVWEGRYPKETKTSLNQYVLAVINNMNSLYKQPTMTEKISFRLVHVEIQTQKPSYMKDYSGAATKYLKSFCEYAAEKNQMGSLWDHALLLTGWDLSEGGSSATAGIAWFSTMCINTLSCSLIEGSTFGFTINRTLSIIIIKEIGHGLGMDHDGQSPRNTKCDANSYLMSPTTGGGKTDWSKCSVQNFKDFLSKGYQGNPSPRCITKKGSKAGSPIQFKSIKLPGQQFDSNAQCEADCKACKPYITSAAPYNVRKYVVYSMLKYLQLL
ncbi:A disintegrin and metalloproteinase with thrombospondin motifs 18 [Orchesella cincta]|uniref:A disintegrin and metalloproteinase with thrombospondin motifs 18 n=1 Tax=Orchesella cincta TaxID=48709 RepID=A0A1D2NIR8_ORCCI|nr:A disintegrin and metalloproteinase with thrombospondin motifs 18 [Orchesella cincta]